jgi:dolichol kinase
MKHLGRKFFHLFGGLGLLSIFFLFDRNHAFRIYGALVLIVLVFEIGRLKIPAVNRLLFRYFGSFVRKKEENSLTGTIPYILGVSLSLYAYSVATASAAICFLAFGDVAATTIGERYGRTKIGDKSLEGSAAFVILAAAVGCALLIVLPGYPVWVMLFGALIAACVELLPLVVNDNFAIPVLAGAAMEIALRWAR